MFVFPIESCIQKIQTEWQTVYSRYVHVLPPKGVGVGVGGWRGDAAFDPVKSALALGLV